MAIMTPEELQRYALLSNAFGRISALGSPGGQQPSALMGLVGAQKVGMEQQEMAMKAEEARLAAEAQRAKALRAQQLQQGLAEGLSRLGGLPGQGGGIQEAPVGNTSPAAGLPGVSGMMDPRRGQLANIARLAQVEDEKPNAVVEKLLEGVSLNANQQAESWDRNARIAADMKKAEDDRKHQIEMERTKFGYELDKSLNTSSLGQHGKMVDTLQAEQPKVKQVVNNLSTVKRMEKVLEDGDPSLGPGTDVTQWFKVLGAKAFGQKTPKSATDTALIVQGIAKQVLQARETQRGLGSITELENRDITTAAGGDISKMSPEILKTVLKIAKETGITMLDQYTMMHDRITKLPIAREMVQNGVFLNRKDIDDMLNRSPSTDKWAGWRVLP